MGATGLFVIAMVSWAPYVSDYSRYLPETVSKPQDVLGGGPGLRDPADRSARSSAPTSPGCSRTRPRRWRPCGEVAGSWALPVMAVSLIGSDVANAYTGMLAVASIVSCVQRRAALGRDAGDRLAARDRGRARLSPLLGYQQFVNNLANFLNVLLYVFIPWSAINLTDYYLVKHGDYDVASFFTPTAVTAGTCGAG